MSFAPLPAIDHFPAPPPGRSPGAGWLLNFRPAPSPTKTYAWNQVFVCLGPASGREATFGPKAGTQASEACQPWFFAWDQVFSGEAGHSGCAHGMWARPHACSVSWPGPCRSPGTAQIFWFPVWPPTPRKDGTDKPNRGQTGPPGPEGEVTVDQPFNALGQQGGVTLAAVMESYGSPPPAATSSEKGH